ncbi:MAG: chemotaxis protein CheB [Pyrinomonadaceae bacterium]
METRKPLKSGNSHHVKKSSTALNSREPGKTAGGQSADTTPGNAAFPVVGIGASAGGLEAFTRLLQNLPVDTGMSFVLVQHLDPVHESALTKILSKATRMQVREVTNNTRVQPNKVHIIPPNTSLTITQGVLKLQPRKKTDGMHRPIDHFFHSLAEDQHERAISVILSGTATDGTLGCEVIKAEGGITFAQDESAKYDSMPRSAIAAGCIDFVLSPEDIANELARIACHPYVRSDGAPITASDLEEGLPESPKAEKTKPGANEDPTKKILALLRNKTGVDFSLYKSNTINRRLTRRTVLSKEKNVESYHRLLKSDATELEALYQDLLISVTGFFRNPEAFEVLKRKVFPKVLKNRPSNDTTRVWVLGCSTGQEAYSIAMAYLEFAGKNDSNLPLQIFATDLNSGLLEKARGGLYATNLVQDLSPDRLRRFFSKEDGGYRISKSIREMCVFARQNLITDPPFSRLDLISCRNLMIYLEPSLQRKIIPTFHYSLKPNGFLFLGSSETVGANTDLFATVDHKHKIYSKKPATRTLNISLLTRQMARHTPPPKAHSIGSRDGFELDAQKEADRITLSRYAPAGVLINADLEVLQFRGMTSPYLSPAPGRASFNLLKMAREELLLPLRTSITKAKKQKQRVRKENIQIDDNGSVKMVSLEVIPLTNVKELTFLIVFEARTAVIPSGDNEVGAGTRTKARVNNEGKITGADEHTQNAELKTELTNTREYLQTIQEEHEGACEELQASNEELQSANEELQSINEELETSKEELESTNEELITVNEEMVNRNAELSRLNSDIVNLQSSINVAILLLGRDLSIRRFTQPVEKLFNLLTSDIGRHIGVIKENFNFPGLEKLISEVIESLAGQDREVQDANGRWFLLRVRPYMTIDNKIDGAVLMLVDITTQKQAEEVKGRLAAIIQSSNDAIISKDLNGIIATWNHGAQNLFGHTAQEAIGKPITMLIAPERMHEEPGILERIRQGKQVGYYETIGMRKDGTSVNISLAVSPIFDSNGDIVGASRIARDITDRKRVAEEKAALLLREQEARAQAEAANRVKDEFLAMVSHELRTPLNAIVGWTHLLKGGKLNQRESEHAIQTIDRNATAQAAIISELLDVSSIISGKLKLDMKPVDLADVIIEAVDAIRPAADAKGIEVVTSFDQEAGLVAGEVRRLQQVIWNLLTNAIKFTPKEGRVEVQLKRADHHVAVVVSDTGTGISSDFLPYVFERFQQADTSEKRMHGGLGLGLSIVRNLVELHGGSVSATSDGKGRGASFTVTIPILTISSRVSAPSFEEVSSQRSVYAEHYQNSEDRQHLDLKPDILKGVRVLAVDDQPDTRDLIIVALTRYGAEVRACTSAVEACKLIENWKPEVIVSDIGMPGEDGYDLMRKVRALTPKSGGNIPAIALTGYASAVDESKAFAAGYQVHMTKPVELRELAATVAKLAASKDTAQTAASKSLT